MRPSWAKRKGCDMFEAFVLSYGDLSEPAHLALAFGLVVLGALGAMVILPAPAVGLVRSEHYLRLALATFLLAATQILWLFYVPALKLGVSFAFVAMDVAASLGYGAYVAQIARARSLDGWGSGGWAWMAFVPLANLWLIFKPSLAPDPNRGSGLLVVAGLVLMLLGRAVTGLVEGGSDEIARQINADPEAQSILQALRLQVDGVEAALDELIRAEAAPQEIEPGLRLTSVSRQGSKILYAFTLDEPGATSLDPAYSRQVHMNFCGALMAYLQGGATGEVVYSRPDGLELARLALSVKDCTA